MTLNETIEAVERNSQEWVDSAISLMNRVKVGQLLTAEQLRTQLETLGLPQPRHPSCWGPLIKRLIINGHLINTHQYVLTEMKRRPTPVYSVQ